MPPAGRGRRQRRTLHRTCLPALSCGRRRLEKSFQLEAEWNCDGTACSSLQKPRTHSRCSLVSTGETAFPTACDVYSSRSNVYPVTGPAS
ncbi:MAG: hypothetical protein LBQ54_12720 [Planctomycetaceae bacterium]|nr:hypothetical protein [Planctomycetaceae bacterium]